ncbi:MAG: GNAT family protein [Acidobacteriota bacterium]
MAERHGLVAGDLDGFFSAPTHAYGPRSLYVSPMRADLARLLSRENPLFEGDDDFAYFTWYDQGVPRGRITAHLHRASNEHYRIHRAYFGYFACADDPTAAEALLTAAEDWARSRRCDEIIGSFDLTAMQQIGILTEGFDRTPYIDMQHNPEHLPRLLRDHGYRPRFPMSTFETDLTTFDPETLRGPAQRQLMDGDELRWTLLTRRRFGHQMEDVREVLNDGFADNPMFVPLSSEEFAFQAGGLMWIVDSRLSCLAYAGSEPVGVVVCIPDLNPFLRATGSRLSIATPWHFLRHRLRRRRAVILFYSVARAWHGRGLAGAMLFRVTSALRSAGYTRLGTTWIADGNPASLRQMEKLGAERLHRLHLFVKELT